MKTNRRTIRLLLVYAFYIILLSQLQVTLPDQILILGSRPDLTLVLVIACGYLFGRQDGVLAGLAAGFMRDLFAGRTLGLGMLIFMYIGLLAGTALRSRFRLNIFIGLLQVVWLTAVYELTVTVIVYLAPMLPDVVHDARTLFGLAAAALPTQLLANLAAALPLLLLLWLAGPYRRSGQLETDEDSEKNQGDALWPIK